MIVQKKKENGVNRKRGKDMHSNMTTLDDEYAEDIILFGEGILGDDESKSSTSYNTFTTIQLYALAIGPRISAIISFTCMIWMIYTTWKNIRKNTYHRLMFGLSFHQLSDSTWAIIGPAAVPKDTPNGPYGAIGNTTTCTIQGFFGQVSFCVPFYYVLLSVYSFVLIKHKFQLSKYIQYEKYLHILAHVFPIGSAFYLLSLDAFNYTGHFDCWISSLPFECGEDTGIPCVRGPQNVETMAWIFAGAPAFFCMLFPTIMMISLYIMVYYRKQVQTQTTTTTTTTTSGGSGNPSGTVKTTTETTDDHVDTNDTNTSTTTSTKKKKVPKRNSHTFRVCSQGKIRPRQQDVEDIKNDSTSKVTKTKPKDIELVDIPPTIVLKQAGLYLCTIYWCYLFTFTNEALHTIGEKKIFVMALLADVNINLRGFYFMLIYRYFTIDRRSRKKRTTTITKTGGDNLSDDGEELDICDNTEFVVDDGGNDNINHGVDDQTATNTSNPRRQQQQKLHQKQKQQQLAEEVSFNIFDGTNASGRYAQYIFDGDSDDEEEDRRESIIWEDIQTHV